MNAEVEGLFLPSLFVQKLQSIVCDDVSDIARFVHQFAIPHHGRIVVWTSTTLMPSDTLSVRL